MQKEKQVVIKSMDVTLSKATVKREGAKDEPKRAMAYMTFATALTDQQLENFGLSDVAIDPRFKPGEEIVLSEMKQELQGTIDLTISMIKPVTGEAIILVESSAILTKMTLEGIVFSVEASYPLTDGDDWKCFGEMFTDYIGADMEITAKPDNRGKQEHFKQEHIDAVTAAGCKVIGKGHAEKAAQKLGGSLNEGESITFTSPKTGKKATIKGKKKKKGGKK